MTHTSSYRYGSFLSIAEPHSAGRSSEVRVSYFDPVTGKPCATKPKPLDKKAKPKQTAHERFAQRKQAEDEAAEIMRNMKKRRASRPKKPSESNGGRKRPVLVDGKPYESVIAAAKAIGTSEQYLGKVLLNGKSKIKGREVRFAEVVE